MQPLSNEYSIVDGILEQARWSPSPNCEPRPANVDIDLLVIHCISLPPGKYGRDNNKKSHYVEDFFLNCLNHNEHPYFQQLIGVKVSAHLFVARDGEIIQFVNFNDRAWHAGESCFEGRTNCNNFSIGIELEGLDTDGYSPEQYNVLINVAEAIKKNYPAVTNDNIVGHEDIAPVRKTDPGPGFDWKRFKQALEQCS